MLIGIMGKMGSGKTLSMSILGRMLQQQLQVPLISNYSLKNAEHVTSIETLWKYDKAIFCFDEAWITLDARNWKDKKNIDMTRWINQTRKKNLLVFYTTQHIRQMELRMRTATDILIYCERKGPDFWLTFIDFQYMKIGRKFRLSSPEKYFNIYNTFETVSPLT